MKFKRDKSIINTSYEVLNDDWINSGHCSSILIVCQVDKVKACFWGIKVLIQEAA